MSISVKGLSFSYEKLAVLDGVDLEIAPGRFVGIFGPNGGGKTTFLNLLIGQLKPEKGSIILAGKSPKDAITQVGYVPQIRRFDRQFPISVLEVVLQGILSKLSWWGFFTKEQKDKARSALAQVDLLHKEKDSFGTLSGGEMQRALIARALVGEPKILLLDEATAHVDLSTQRQILELLIKLKGSMTILMVTHDLQMIVNEAETLVCINRKLNLYEREEVCRHFSIGLYHPPRKSDG